MSPLFEIRWCLYSRPDGPFYGSDVEEFIEEPTKRDIEDIMADVADPHPSMENLERTPSFSDTLAGSCNPSHWRVTSIHPVAAPLGKREAEKQ